jgi:hypothetical protein
MPDITATQEANIRRIEALPGKKFTKLYLNRKDWSRWCSPVTLATVGSINRKIAVLAGPSKKASPYLKNNQSKKDRGVAQAIEHLPRMHEALISNLVHPQNSSSQYLLVTYYVSGTVYMCLHVVTNLFPYCPGRKMLSSLYFMISGMVKQFS